MRCGKCKHEWLATRPVITVPDDTLVIPPNKIIPEAPGTHLPALAPEMRHAAQRNGIVVGIMLAVFLVVPLFFIGHGSKDKAASEKEATPVVVPEAHEKIIMLDGTPVTLLREEQGRMILSIEGALINHADKRLKVPLLRAEALNAKRKVVKDWTIPLSAEDLEPGQRLPFSFTAPFVEQGVVDIAFHLE